MFIADSGDNVVREITPAGLIHRFAGTAARVRGSSRNATPASWTTPDVAVNAQGDAYIADTYNNRVVEVTPRGGHGRRGHRPPATAATAAWRFAALDQPTGVAVDAQGQPVHRRRREQRDPPGRRQDRDHHHRGRRLRRRPGQRRAGRLQRRRRPRHQAQLNDPQGVAVDGAGDLFIADTFNNAIREVTPAGTISTVVERGRRERRRPGGRRREQRRGAHGLAAERPVRGRRSTCPRTPCTSPTPTTARSPQ